MADEKLFYKYQGIDDKDSNHTIENLSKNQFYFSDLTNFNDPFDSKVNSFYRGKKEEWFEWLKNIGNDPAKINNMIKLNIDNGILKKEDDFIISDSTNQKDPSFHGTIHKKIYPRVNCFTETDDNILMWSHYADGHQGICLRFWSNQAADGYFLILNSIPSPFHEVEYKDDLPPAANMFDENRHKAITKFLSTKYSDWKYEKEYRMLLFEDELEEGTIKFKKEDLEGIIFGLKIEPKNVERIYNIINKKYLKDGIHINFYEAKEIHGKYKVQIEKIDDIDKYLDSFK